MARAQSRRGTPPVPAAARAASGRGKPGGPAAAAMAGPVVAKGAPIGWITGLLCGLATAFATPSAVLLAVLLAPGLVALLLDQRQGRPLARAVLLFCTAAAVDPMHRLWVVGHSMTTALALLSDPRVLAVDWLAAGAGWALTQLLPPGMTMLLDMRRTERERGLRKQHAALVEEWGYPGNAADDSAVSKETPEKG